MGTRVRLFRQCWCRFDLIRRPLVYSSCLNKYYSSIQRSGSSTCTGTNLRFLTSSKIISSSSGQRYLCSEPSNHANIGLSPSPTTTEPTLTASAIENTFTTLKMKLERLGHLNVSDIARAMKCFEANAEEVSSEDYLRLMQMSVRAVEEEYRPCADMVQRIWRLFEGRRMLLTQRHIEIYFKMCLMAEVPVNPKEILDELKSYGVEQSRELLDLSLLLLGWQGELPRALEMLTVMREENIPITETIFSSLIISHGINKDSDGIHSVLDTMRSVQMRLTSTTYEALMIAYAAAGLVAEMKRVVGQMRAANVALSQSELSSVLLSLIKHGQAGNNFENIDYVIELMKSSEGKLDLSRVVLQCIHSSHVVEAIHILPSQPLIKQNNHLYANAIVYIREMVHAQLDPELIVKMCDELQQKDINQFGHEVALGCALAEHREEMAWVLLRAIGKNGKPLRQHYFWPLLHCSALKNDSSKLLACLKQMTELGVKPDLETLRDYAVPGLIINHPGLTQDMLQDASIIPSDAATAILIVLVRNNMLDQCLEFVKEVKTHFLLSNITSTLAAAWPSHPQTIIALLAALMQKDKSALTKGEVKLDWGGQFVLDLASSRAALNVDQIRPLFQELHKQNIGISESSADYLMSRTNKTIQGAIRDNLKIVLNPSLGQPPKEVEYNLLPHPGKMTTEELECHLVELRAKGLNTRGTLRKLLIAHTSNNNCNRVLELFKEAEADGKELSAGMMASIMTSFIEAGNVTAGVDIYNQIRAQHPTFKMDAYKIIDMCTMLISKGKIEESMSTLGGYLEGVSRKPVPKKSIKRNCRNLLVTSAETEDYESTRLIFDMLLSSDLIETDIIMLGPLVKAKLNGGDLSGALEEAKRLYKEYKCLPMRIELMVHLIHQSKDSIHSLEDDNLASEQLQMVMDLTVKARGSTQALHDLLFACLEAGQPSDARKVLQSLGRNLDMKQMERQCERYTKTGRDDPLKHFLKASQGSTIIKQDMIYKALLNLYYKQNDGKKGLSLWTKMQEDEVIPSPPFLSTLASLLAATNIKIPFQVPESVTKVQFR